MSPESTQSPTSVRNEFEFIVVNKREVSHGVVPFSFVDQAERGSRNSNSVTCFLELDVVVVARSELPPSHRRVWFPYRALGHLHISHESSL